VSILINKAKKAHLLEADELWEIHLAMSETRTDK
jgi:hypothetical protein